MASGLPAFVEDVPEYAVRDGRMYISMGGMVVAMPIHIFEIGCVHGRAAIAEWQRERGADSGRVVPFEGRAGH